MTPLPTVLLAMAKLTRPWLALFALLALPLPAAPSSPAAAPASSPAAPAMEPEPSLAWMHHAAREAAAEAAEEAAEEAAAGGLVAGISDLSWVDLTAIAIVIVFFVLGLFRGFVWQVSRILTLVLAYLAAVLWGHDVADQIRGWFGEGADEALPFYVACFLIFLGVLVVVSVIAYFVQKLVQKTGLSFYNRVGGGVLGLATGALVVMALLTAVFMFFGTQSGIVEAADRSRSAELSRDALGAASDVLPSDWKPVPREWRRILQPGGVTATDVEPDLRGERLPPDAPTTVPDGGK